MLLAGTTKASPLKRRVDLTEVDLSGDNCILKTSKAVRMTFRRWL